MDARLDMDRGNTSGEKGNVIAIMGATIDDAMTRGAVTSKLPTTSPAYTSSSHPLQQVNNTHCDVGGRRSLE